MTYQLKKNKTELVSATRVTTWTSVPPRVRFPTRAMGTHRRKLIAHSTHPLGPHGTALCSMVSRYHLRVEKTTVMVPDTNGTIRLYQDGMYDRPCNPDDDVSRRPSLDTYTFVHHIPHKNIRARPTTIPRDGHKYRLQRHCHSIQ